MSRHRRSMTPVNLAGRVMEAQVAVAAVTVNAPGRFAALQPLLGNARSRPANVDGLKSLLCDLGVTTPRQLLSLLQLISVATAVGSLTYAVGGMPLGEFMAALALWDPDAGS